ncbi:MAG: hypothetical protein U1E66_08535 [Rhodospirillales bacterium]
MIIILVALFVPEPGNWLAVSILVSPLSVLLTHIAKFIELFPNAQVRSTMLYLLLFLPFIGFWYGRQQAFAIKNGAAEQVLDVVRSKLSLANDEKNPVAYLGLLGNTYILREAKTGQIVLLKQSDESPLFLAPRR